MLSINSSKRLDGDYLKINKKELLIRFLEILKVNFMLVVFRFSIQKN